MDINPFDGYPHIVYWCNSNHSHIGARILEVIYKYRDASGSHELLLNTLPQEIDETTPPPGRGGMHYFGFAVTMDMKIMPSGTVEGGVSYKFLRQYSHNTPSQNYAALRLYIYYQSITIDYNGNVTIGDVENVLDMTGAGAVLGVASDDTPDDGIESLPYNFGPFASWNVSMAHDEESRPFISFSINQLLSLGPPYRARVCYRYKDINELWAGSQWAGPDQGFTQVIYNEIANVTASGVSAVMDTSQTPNVPCVAFAMVYRPGSSSIFYSEFPFSTQELAASALADPTDYSQAVNVSLAIDSGFARHLAYDGKGVFYVEKEFFGNWSTPALLKGDGTGEFDGKVARLGSLALTITDRIWVSIFDNINTSYMIVSTKWRNASGTWYNMEVGNAGSLLWSPMLKVEPLYSQKPQIAFGIIDSAGTVNRLCSAIVELKNALTGDSIYNGSVVLKKQGSSQTWNHDTIDDGYYQFHEVFSYSNESFICDIKATASGYNTVDYGSYTVDINRGLCGDTVTVLMTPKLPCSAEPIRSDSVSERSLLIALLPLGIALTTILAWSLLRQRLRQD